MLTLDPQRNSIKRQKLPYPVLRPLPQVAGSRVGRASFPHCICPRLEPRPCVNSAQHLPHLGSAGAWWGGGDFSPADPGLQDLHDREQQQDFREGSQWWPSVSGVAEARGLELEQSFFAMDFFMKMYRQRGLLSVSLYHTAASMMRLPPPFFSLSFILL